MFQASLAPSFEVTLITFDRHTPSVAGQLVFRLSLECTIFTPVFITTGKQVTQ